MIHAGIIQKALVVGLAVWDNKDEIQGSFPFDSAQGQDDDVKQRKDKRQFLDRF